MLATVIRDYGDGTDDAEEGFLWWPMVRLVGEKIGSVVETALIPGYHAKPKPGLIYPVRGFKNLKSLTIAVQDDNFREGIDDPKDWGLCEKYNLSEFFPSYGFSSTGAARAYCKGESGTSAWITSNMGPPNYNAAWTLDGVTLKTKAQAPSPVPLPASLPLLAVALASAAAIGRLKRKAK
jgi:hypothetical protein